MWAREASEDYVCRCSLVPRASVLGGCVRKRVLTAGPKWTLPYPGWRCSLGSGELLLYRLGMKAALKRIWIGWGFRAVESVLSHQPAERARPRVPASWAPGLRFSLPRRPL